MIKKKALLLIFLALIFSCGRNSPDRREDIISVSIAPFKYFVEEIAGEDFYINVMVPAGASPHVYEPYPGQINKLRKSLAYISNGYLGFEASWLGKFYEVNKSMARLSLGDRLEPLETEHSHNGEHSEGADPHYWLSPKYAIVIAGSVKDFLCSLNPEEASKYNVNYESLVRKISDLDQKAGDLFSGFEGSTFISYHPTLAYLARDYGLEEVTVEHDGKEPSPARLKELIDLARQKNIKNIFLTREYNIRQVETLADETGADIVVIDPLSENWLDALTFILEALYDSFVHSTI